MALEGELFIGMTMAFFIGIAIFIDGLLNLRKMMIIRNIPTSKIRSIAMGLVEIYGRVVPGNAILKAPLSGENCIYYKYEIYDTKNASWRNKNNIRRGEERIEFCMEDSTGRVKIVPEGAEIRGTKCVSMESGHGKNLPPLAVDLLKKTGMSQKGPLGSDRCLSLTEYHIPPGDNLYVMGTACKNPSTYGRTSKSHVENIVIRKGSNDKFYYISGGSEKEILRETKFTVYVFTIGGIVLISVSMAFFFPVIFNILSLFTKI